MACAASPIMIIGPLCHVGTEGRSWVVHPASLPEVRRPTGRFERLIGRVLRRRSGYWGAPAKAAPEAGREELEQRLDDVFPKLRAVWEGSNPNMLFRSYYSLLPPNWSFFRAWILFGCVLVVMLIWMFLTFPHGLV